MLLVETADDQQFCCKHGKIRDGEKGEKWVLRWGEREIIYLSLHCDHQSDSCIKMGSDESHFNVSEGSDG